MTSLEEIDKLKKIVADYADKLNQQIGALEEASDVCDQAMGSDDLSKKYIAKLDNSIGELRKALGTCNNVIGALQEDYNEIVRMLEEFD